MRGSVLVGLVLCAVAHDAAALFGSSKCDRTDNDKAQASRVIENLTGQIDALELTIVEALRLHATQVSAVIGTNATAFGNALDGANLARAEMLRDVEESRAVRDHAPSETVCEGITGMSGLAPGRGAAGGGRGRAFGGDGRAHDAGSDRDRGSGPRRAMRGRGSSG